MKRIRTLIVDDSATMRGLISAALQLDPEIEVVGQAGDPLEAREAIKSLNPDVVTLDIEMPNMNGLDFLEKIMRLRPTPVIMVSTLTKAGEILLRRARSLEMLIGDAEAEVHMQAGGIDGPLRVGVHRLVYSGGPGPDELEVRSRGREGERGSVSDEEGGREGETYRQTDRLGSSGPARTSLSSGC